MSNGFDKYEKKGDYHWKEYEKKFSKTYDHVEIVREWIKEKNVLDIGAGDGLIAGLMGFRGVDNEPEGVRLAQEHGADVVLGDAYKLPFDDEQFDAVFMGDTLEHLEFPRKAIREARRVLKHYFYIANPIKRDYLEKRHFQEWTPAELVELFESEGFELEGEVRSEPKLRRDYAKFRKV